MINKVTIILFLILVTVGIAFAGLTFEYFTGKTSTEGILLEWKTGDENGTVKFEVERSAFTPNSFIFVKTVNASGSNSYYSVQDNGVEVRRWHKFNLLLQVEMFSFKRKLFLHKHDYRSSYCFWYKKYLGEH